MQLSVNWITHPFKQYHANCEAQGDCLGSWQVVHENEPIICKFCKNGRVTELPQGGRPWRPQKENNVVAGAFHAAPRMSEHHMPSLRLLSPFSEGILLKLPLQ